MKGEVQFLEFRAGTPRPVPQCDITDYNFFFSDFGRYGSVKAIIKFSLIFFRIQCSPFLMPEFNWARADGVEIHDVTARRCENLKMPPVFRSCIFSDLPSVFS